MGLFDSWDKAVLLTADEKAKLTDRFSQMMNALVPSYAQSQYQQMKDQPETFLASGVRSMPTVSQQADIIQKLAEAMPIAYHGTPHEWGAQPTQSISRTAEDFTLAPSKMAGLKYNMVAFKRPSTGEVISAKIGGKFKGQEIYNHADLQVAAGVHPDEVIPGFLDRQGKFVIQYPEEKALAESVNVSTRARPEPRMEPRPDLSKIGTGQGAQSYGHGLYFAENPATAKTYQEMLTSTTPGAFQGGSKYQVKGFDFPLGRSGHMALDTGQDIEAYLAYKKMGSEDMAQAVKGQLENRIGRWFQQTKPGQEKAGSANEHMSDLVDYWQRIKNAKPSDIYEKSGSMYQVNIPDEHVAKMLDWDKPLSEQPDVAKLIKEKLSTWAQRPNYNLFDLQDWNRMTGGDFYQWMAKGDAPEKVSRQLQSMGIPGIKYLDQGSRGVTVEPSMGGRWVVKSYGNLIKRVGTQEEAQAIADKMGTRNFVVFDPNIIKDVKKMQ